MRGREIKSKIKMTIKQNAAVMDPLDPLSLYRNLNLNLVFHLLQSAAAIMTLWLPPSASAQTSADATAAKSSLHDRGTDRYAAVRDHLVRTRIESAGVTNPRVLDAIRHTPRHEFVPRDQLSRAYYDMALPIGQSQTISSPFIVASMTEALDPQPTDKVLEIGTGSGYQAAVLSPLVAEVYSIEIVRPLGRLAADVLQRLQYDNVHTRIGDGFAGWPEAAPFDKIIVTCSPESVPTPLVEQLREGGQMIVPVGQRYQQTLFRMVKREGQLVRQPLRPTLFVPMTGAAEDGRVQQPDPDNPVVVNGDFQDADWDGDVSDTTQGGPSVADPDNPFVPGWYYGRQVRLVGDSDNRYVRFENETPGLASHLLQGIAIDGRNVRSIRLSAKCRTENVRSGPSSDELPMLAISLYDEVRGDVGAAVIGPFRGSRPWKTISRIVTIPPKTREAILRIGLFGATGIAEFDDVRIEVRR